MVAHLKPSASHAAHLHRFTNAALFKVLLNKLYLFIYLFIYFFQKYFSYFFVQNCSALRIDFWKWRRLKNLQVHLFLFDLLSFILSYLSYHLSISYYSILKSHRCCRNLIFPVVQKSLTNLNPYQSCLVLFFACFFCCASGPVEHMGTVGICLTQLAEKKFLGENCAL